MNKLKIYTDGSCDNKTKIGGWGFVMLANEHVLEVNGNKNKTTSNRMELMAVLKSLSMVTKPSAIEVVTDSQYVVKGINSNGYEHQGDDFLNSDLWIKVRRQLDKHYVKVKWVRGHSGDYYNEKADKLANRSRISLVNFLDRLKGRG